MLDSIGSPRHRSVSRSADTGRSGDRVGPGGSVGYL